MNKDVSTKAIESKILTIRNQPVMLDRDLAELYGVETRRLNEQVKRNIERFPDSFMFQLTREEVEIVKSQIVTSKMENELVMSQIATSPEPMLTAQDIQKFNAQYPVLTVKNTTKMHDRFLIIDRKTLYHIGASLKDLGKKCFAFEVLDSAHIPYLLQNV